MKQKYKTNLKTKVTLLLNVVCLSLENKTKKKRKVKFLLSSLKICLQKFTSNKAVDALWCWAVCLFWVFRDFKI